MIKKNIYIISIFLLIFLNGCGYKPVLKKASYDFSFVVIDKSGNEKINSIIEKKLNTINGNKRSFKVILISKESKNVISKDSKGDPTILEAVINLNYKLYENSKILVNRTLTQRSTYNNISDKFELRKSEEILTDNLVDDLVSDIINSTSNFILNPMINDN